MEAALGMSYAGKRSLTCMKHVGLNVAADVFMNMAITGVNGGLVLAVADDPSQHSSQNEQDSRFYGKFAMIPVFEPSNQQEAYDMTLEAFDFSEKTRLAGNDKNYHTAGTFQGRGSSEKYSGRECIETSGEPDAVYVIAGLRTTILPKPAG